jgi:hypothetical protein
MATTAADRSRRLTRLAIGLLGLAALLWILHIPERRDRVFRAMPDNSLMVSEHLELAQVWRERFDNPLLVKTLSGAGVRHAEEWAADTNIVWIVRLVSGPRSLIGWSPALGPSAKPCWTGASWVGMRGRLLNLMLLTRWIPGAGRLLTTPTGVRYLPMKSSKMSGLKLAFALRENVLLATLGEDPEAVRTLEWRLTHDAPLAPLFVHDPAPWKRTGAVPHRAWVAPEISPWPMPLGGPVEVALRAMEPDRLGLAVRVTHTDTTLPADGAALLTGRCAAADALAGEEAVRALLLLPHGTAQGLLARYLRGMPLPPAADAAGAGDDVCLYLSAQSYGGRLFNLAVPALTMLLPWPGDTRGWNATQMVAQVNAAMGLKLRTRVPDPPVPGRTLIDWLGGSRRLRLLSGDDCMVAERHPGWLTLCTSAASLDAQRRAPTGERCSWRAALEARRQMAGERPMGGFLWLDLAATVHELRQAMAVYRLAAAFGALRLSDEESARLERLSAALTAFEGVGRLDAAWFTEAGRIEIELDLSSSPPQTP